MARTDVCPHFPACGGCASQDMPHDAYVAGKREIVVQALARSGVKADVAAVIETPRHARRRAVFKIKSLPEGLHIGFHAAKSHTIIDMHQCDILTPGLFALVSRLRIKLEPIFGVGEAAELHVTECDNGFDAAFRWSRKLAPNLVALLSQALGDTGIIRLRLGNDTVFETASPVVTLAGVAVKPPPHAFLQPTRQGEAALQAHVLALMAKAKTVLDLFSGLGTFALPLAAQARVYAVEAEKSMLGALAAAARNAKGIKPLATETRDLFKRPLTPLELGAYDAVVLDPPRAGAEAQAKALAASKVRRVAYVSCDAASFARDAAILAAGGFMPGVVTPVDQFLFSSHIELVAGFSR
jgi:23S rRNA (uracil1939-C5)-methyltransferase